MKEVYIVTAFHEAGASAPHLEFAEMRVTACYDACHRIVEEFEEEYAVVEFAQYMVEDS